MQIVRMSAAVLMVSGVLITSALPIVAAAQSQEREAVIRTMLLSDPRTASLSREQIEAIVQKLDVLAAQDGVSAADIVWRPEQDYAYSVPDTAQDTCAAHDALCRVNAAFGFTGRDLTIPLWLALSSAALLIIIAAMIDLHYRTPARESRKKKTV